MPELVMLAQVYRGKLEDLPNSNSIIGESKLDGARYLLSCQNGKLALMNRRGQIKNGFYPEVLSNIPTNRNFVIDGEMVVLDKNGIPNFTRLSGREHTTDTVKLGIVMKLNPAQLCAFDVLEIDNIKVAQKPYIERKAILKQLVAELATPAILYVPYVSGIENIKALFESAVKMGGEGIMLKQIDAPYEYRRSSYWMKYKISGEEDFEVIGFSSEKREVSALALAEGGVYKSDVNFGVSIQEHNFWDNQLMEARTGEIQRLGGKDIHMIKRNAFIAKVVYHKRTDAGSLRFPVIKELVKVK